MGSSKKAWYSAPKNDAHKAVFDEVAVIRKQQATARRDIAHYYAMYSNGNANGLGRRLYGDRIRDYLFTGRTGRTHFNMVQAACDTAHSLIASNPPVPTYLGSGLDWDVSRVAEKRTEVLQTQFTDLTRGLLAQWFLDGAITGCGYLQGFLNEDGLPELGRVHPLEMLIEHTDGLNRHPRSTHRVRYVSKEDLKTAHPDKAHLIDLAPVPTVEPAIESIFLDKLTDKTRIVEVVESFHLRSGKRGKDGNKVADGRHTVCIANSTLVDEDFGGDEHPYIVFRYRERSVGFWGAGIAESARDPQNRVNDLIARVARGQDLASTLIILNPNGEGAVQPEEMTNELGLVLNYEAQNGPPQLLKWDGTLADLQQQIDLEFQRFLVTEGLAESQVVGEGAGRGLASGVAQRAADDIKSRRLIQHIERFQNACLDVAKLIERLNDQAAQAAEADDRTYEVKGKALRGQQTFLRTSEWAQLAIQEGQANLSMMPMSALPTTPAGKYAAVMDWLQAGFVDSQYAKKLLNFPDLQGFTELDLADLEYCQWQLQRIVDGEVGVLPEPRQNLTLALDLGRKAKFVATMKSAPPEVLDEFETYLLYAEQLLQTAAPGGASSTTDMATSEQPSTEAA